MHQAQSKNASSSARRQFVRAVRQQVESLEARQLLASVTGGVLNLNGGSGNDAFVVNKSGTNISVVQNGGAAQLFPIASVTLINAVLAGGNDTITIANVLTIPASVSGGAGDDGIITGGGNDTIDAGTGNDYVDGRDGYDTMSYASRQDAITGTDILSLQRGVNSDLATFSISGTAGGTGESDTFINVEALAGGSGNDTLSVGGNSFNDMEETIPPLPTLRVDGNGGDDDLAASNSYDSGLALSNGYPLAVANGGDGNDHFSINASSTGGVTLNGGDGDDDFEQGGTDDFATIVPGNGYDTYEFNAIDLTLSGRTYTMPAGLEHLVVDTGAASVIGNDSDNVIEGDLVYVDARGGNDLVRMNNSSGTILGGDGNDTLIGGNNGDSLSGGTGNDSITGGDGDDTIDGGVGNDYVDGRGGNDMMSYASRQDPITGTDTANITNGPNGYTFQLVGHAGGQGETDNFINIEQLAGGSGNDTLSVGGGEFNNGVPPAIPMLIVYGNGGDDDLVASNSYSGNGDPGSNDFPQVAAYGGDGNDSFYMNSDTSGSSTVYGGAGDDYFENATDDLATIVPGDGYDTFAFDGQVIQTYTMPVGLEHLVASPFAYSVTGNDQDNVIEGAIAHVDARGGNDLVKITQENGTILGGDGNDTLIGGNGGGENSLSGGAGDDVITGGQYGSTNIMDGGTGENTFNVIGGDATITSSSSADHLNVGPEDQAGGHATLNQAENFNSIVIGNYSAVTVAPSVNETNALTVGSTINIHTGGTLDLTNNPLVIDGGAANIEDLETLIRSGRNGGAWNGTGILSSTAANTPGTTLGIAGGNNLFSGATGTVGAQTIRNVDAIVRFTLVGDVNLDRKVDFNDLVILAQNYNGVGRTYAGGNVNYSGDGKVDFNDLVALAQNYGKTLANLLPAIATIATKKTSVARQVLA